MGVEVSPLHARRFKSALPSSTFHVSDTMFPESPPELPCRGVKRKVQSLFDDDDDDDDDAASTSSSSSSTSSEGGSAGEYDFRSYTRRRHAIFNLSLCKLSRFRQAPDPSLLRSVLVCNTLRALERDYLPSMMAAAPVQRPQSSPPLLHYTAASYHPYDCPAHQPAEYQVGDPDNGRLTPFVRCDPGPVLWSEDDRLPSLNWSSVLNFGNPSPPPPPPPASESPTYTLLPANGGTASASTSPVTSPMTSSSSSSSSSNSSSGSDEIFGDIDLSLYDFDLLSPLSPPSVKVAMVSAEEIVRTLSTSSASMTDGIVTMAGASPGSSCQLVASSGQQMNFCYRTLGEEHIATVMS
ncbi:SERTA domain-containing protein 2-like isoform X2 [Ornithodoros turicata]|uniref:SERTA domain-containing protein 2-like isoform X2 n=1 Tax=Ornithodoros turicata TaxID=34597 RepID=UPI00313902E2